MPQFLSLDLRPVARSRGVEERGVGKPVYAAEVGAQACRADGWSEMEQVLKDIATPASEV